MRLPTSTSCYSIIFNVFVLLITAVSINATATFTTIPPSFVPSSPASDCTRVTTASSMFTTTTQAQTTTTMETTTLRIIFYVTPFANGTTLTRTGYEDRIDPSTSNKPLIRRTTIPVVSVVTSANLAPYVNSSMPLAPSLAGCETLTTTLLEITTLTLPGSTVVLTSTTIVAETLFDYDFLTAPTFQPTSIEPAATSPIAQIPQPTSGGTDGFPEQPEPVSPLPQDSPAEPPRPTSVAPTDASLEPPHVTHLTQPSTAAGRPPPVTAPGIGPIVVDTSRSVIFVSGVASPIVPGQQTTINNIPISFDTSASFIVVDGTKSIALPTATPASAIPAVTVGGMTLEVDNLVTKLTPGQATTVNGIPISLDVSSSFLVVDGTRTIPITQAPSNPAALSVVIDRTTINVGSLFTQLTPGQVTTVDGIPISLHKSSSYIVVDGTRTIPIPQAAFAPTASSVVIDGTTINVGELVTKLDPGEATTFGTITISRNSDAALVIGTATIPLTAAPSAIVIGGTTIPAGALPLGYSLVPATAGGGLVLPNGQTLMPGGTTTVDGTAISLTDGATPVVVIEGSVSITASTTANRNPGDYIYSGIREGGSHGPSKTATGVLADYTGGAAIRDGWRGSRWSLGFCILAMEFFLAWL